MHGQCQRMKSPCLCWKVKAVCTYFKYKKKEKSIIDFLNDKQCMLSFRTTRGATLNQVSYIRWHLYDGSVVKLFYIIENSNIILGNEVDGNTFTTKPSSSTNSEKQKRRACQILHEMEEDFRVKDDLGLLLLTCECSFLCL